MTKNHKAYDAGAIEVLQNVEHIRARPGMYIQDTGAAGLHQLVREVLDNALDEHASGHGNQIDVTVALDEPQWCEIADHGRGIPVDRHPKTGISTLATVFLYAGAGGKFSDQTYGRSAGLHGVGVTVVNALSERTTVWSSRAGKSHMLEFQRGVCVQPDGAPVVTPIAKGQPKTGTVVRFSPDTKVFKKARFNLDAVRELCQSAAYLFAGLTVTLRVRRDDQEKDIETESFCSPDGLVGMVDAQVAGGRANRQHATQHVKTGDVELAWCWTNARDESWHSFVNGCRTPDGGTHVTAIKRAFTNALSGATNKPVDTDDLRAGLVVAVHARVQQPQFQGQVKNKLLSRDVEAAVYDAVRAPITRWAQKSKSVVSGIVGRAVRLRAARERFDRERDAARGLDAGARGRRGIALGRLAEAPDCKPEDRELYLVEGESAGGQAKAARDPHHQEVLGLKGKIPNAEQKTRTALFENEEIRLIVQAVGSGVGDACDARKARVGKVLLLMDADPDGLHITALALAFMCRYMAPVVRAGLVWVVRSPLFRAVWRDQTVYGDAMESVKAQFPRKAQPIITRFKGQGECSAGDLRHFAMDAKTRRIERVTVTGDSAAAIEQVMGRQADARRLLVGLDTRT